ncbi:MAG: proton-conducting transporter membrane subunit [Armatimonadota bacterium]|nr:proton-conducting transporter membrane subunit [Armatimonadota bacterium]MDR7444914.1 proton-conducting transporter membrane subunit [Armatimonadota bacterium]MDR7569133.1 proton-conducting transporter membrane subunit [Armatimonadota bacterium]MDR7613421.1 proton-conducting transporter membrane subunit [Armatimonadota bacterium]
MLAWIPLIPILGGLVASAATRKGAGWVSLLVSAMTVAFLGTLVPPVAEGGAVRISLAWFPGIGVRYALRADGLGLLFALLVAGVGLLIVLYAMAYMAHEPRTPAFFCFLLLFMGAMLGVVLADDLVVLYVFWELTSLASFLLIGFHHEDPRARQAALRALLVTVVGGLALLGGIVLLATAGGSLQLPELERRADRIRTSPLYPWMLALVFGGAFTKSAQVPFHFWLVGAMVAPTPVSAYLHSATMVKAGVFLLMRLSPVLGGTGVWEAWLGPVGIATYLFGSLLALFQDDLKALLAYGTVASLGLATALVGTGPEGVLAGMAYLLAHAGYKGTLFLVAGAVEHEAGTRRLSELHGLGRTMPLTAAAAVAAVLSMLGIPGFAGFVAKGTVEKALHGWAHEAVLAGGVLTAGYGIRFLGVFRGSGRRRGGHEAPGFLFPALALALVGPVLGLHPVVFEQALRFLQPGVNLSSAPVLGKVAIPVGSALLGAVLARGVAGFSVPPALPGGEVVFDRVYGGVLGFAGSLTRLTVTGRLRDYLGVSLLVPVAGVGAVILSQGRLPSVPVRMAPYEGVVLLLGLGAVGFTVLARSLVAQVVAVGAVGYTVALLYIGLRAPDLALTQILVETVTLVLFLAVVLHLRHPEEPDRHPAWALDLLIALGVGALAAALAALILPGPPTRHLFSYFVQRAPEAGGRNLVNLIVVDFRGLDTLGEITVLGIAALGVLALASRPGTRVAHHLVAPVRSLILETAVRVASPTVAAYALVLLATGHYGPGGGFVAGLMTAMALLIWAVAFGFDAIPQDWLRPLAVGLGIAYGTGFLGVALGRSFLTHSPILLGPVKTTTSLLFDFGVYVLVVGASLSAARTLVLVRPR